MKEIVGVVQTVITAIGAFVGWFLGGMDGFLYTLIIMVTMDYLSGLTVAIVQRRLSSEIGARGIFKKVLIFAFVAMGHIIDTHIFHSGSAIRTAVIFYYISNEGISVLENATLLGMKVPKKLREVLAQINSEKESEKDKNMKGKD